MLALFLYNEFEKLRDAVPPVKLSQEQSQEHLLDRFFKIVEGGDFWGTLPLLKNHPGLWNMKNPQHPKKWTISEYAKEAGAFAFILYVNSQSQMLKPKSKHPSKPKPKVLNIDQDFDSDNDAPGEDNEDASFTPHLKQIRASSSADGSLHSNRSYRNLRALIEPLPSASSQKVKHKQ